MEKTNPTRGRGAGRAVSNRSRSQRGRGFFGIQKQREAKQLKDAETEKIEKSIKEAEELAKLPDHPKKQELIQKGKNFFSKFIDGYRKTNRSNVLVEFDEECVNRMLTPYINRIMNDCRNNRNIDENRRKKMSIFYEGYGVMATGIKLMISGTDTNKMNFRRYDTLIRMQIKLPMKLTEMIDQIGKTDLGNDDILRIKHQNMNAIQMMARACATIFKEAEFWNGNVIGTRENWANFYTEKNWRKMYTLDANGVEYIRNESIKTVKSVLDLNYERQIGTNVYVRVRMPTFKMDEDRTVTDMVEWSTNVGDITKWRFAQDETISNNVKNQIAGYVLGCFITRDWLKQRSTALKTIDSRWDNTMFGNLTPNLVLQAAGFYCIEDVLEYDDLIDNVILIQQMYDESFASTFDRSLNIREIKFRETGTAAQIIMSEQLKKPKVNENGPYNELDTNYVPSLYRKIDNAQAGFGLITNYSKQVEIKQDFAINYSGQVTNIRDQLVQNDFR